MNLRVALAAVLLATAGCVGPIPLTDERLFGTLAARYGELHHGDGRDPDPALDADLVAPRFGLPRFVRAGEPIAVEWLERGGPQDVRFALAPRALGRRDPRAALRCLDEAPPAGCVALAATAVERTAIDGTVARVAARLTGQVAGEAAGSGSPRAFDLLFAPGHDAPTRAPAAVWLSDEDPEAPRPLRLALLSDPHIGKRVAHLEENLLTVIDELNHRPLDVVVVAGDITNMGTNAAQAPRARQLLERIDAPVLVTIGNHDHGFERRVMFSAELGSGYFHFARSFHGLLYYKLALAGWELIGFDSGPSRPSMTINNRGLHPESLRRLADDLAAARTAGRRGVLLLSHCTSRASLSGRALTTHPGWFGHMEEGGEELERLAIENVEAGLRTYHLGGHTHWSDLFEAHRDEGGRYRYHLHPEAPREAWRPLAAPAAIVTVQSASHPGLFVKESAHGFGYVLMNLDAARSELYFVRHLDTVRKAPGAVEGTTPFDAPTATP